MVTLSLTSRAQLQDRAWPQSWDRDRVVTGSEVEVNRDTISKPQPRFLTLAFWEKGDRPISLLSLSSLLCPQVASDLFLNTGCEEAQTSQHAFCIAHRTGNLYRSRDRDPNRLFTQIILILCTKSCALGLEQRGPTVKVGVGIRIIWGGVWKYSRLGGNEEGLHCRFRASPLAVEECGQAHTV